MKQNIHPAYHTITVEMTDGSTFETRTTWGKEGDVMRLEADRIGHPAWTGSNQRKLMKSGQVSRFQGRYGSFGARKEVEEPAAE